MEKFMTIQWYPGHMAKAKREVTEKLKYVDIVFELIDARLPLSSRNPMLDQIIQQKKRLILLNKSDLADPDQNKKWVNYFTNLGNTALLVNAKQDKGINKIVLAAKETLKEKQAREKEKGLKKRPIKAMCIGIPNVGKSTLMNRLIGKKVAQTGNKPGVTKGQQWLRVGNDLELLDTPGILWPKFEDPEVGKKLALTGAIKDQLLYSDDLAIYGLEFFTTFYPESLQERFHLSESDIQLPPAELLIMISEKHGFKTDYERTSNMIIQEIRSGRLGTYTLDRCTDCGEED